MARNPGIDKGHIDEGTLHAWLDGALSAEESARVEAHVNGCATCGAAAAEARGLVAGASRILTALDDVPGGVAPGGRQAGGRISASAGRGRRLWTGWPLRAAAAVLFVAVGSFAVIRQMSDKRVAYYGTLETRPQASVAPTPVAAAPVAPAALAKKQELVARKRDVKAAKPTAPPPADAPAPAVAPGMAAAPMAAAQAPSLAVTDSVRAVPPGPVTITGHVVDFATGQPIEGAQVHLSSPSVSVVSNQNGDYALPVPANQASPKPAQITVRRIGFEAKVDSVMLAQAAADTVRHDIALKESKLALSEVVVSGAADAARAMRGRRVSRVPSAPGCYRIDTPGLPSLIEIGEHLRVLPPDSAAFPTAYWMPVGQNAVRIVLGDTTGTTQEVKANVSSQGLSGFVTRSDSVGGATPFSATWTATRCP